MAEAGNPRARLLKDEMRVNTISEGTEQGLERVHRGKTCITREEQEGGWGKRGRFLKRICPS